MQKGTAQKRFPIAQKETVKRLAKCYVKNMTVIQPRDGHIAFMLTVIKSIITATIIFKIEFSISNTPFQ